MNGHEREHYQYGHYLHDLYPQQAEPCPFQKKKTKRILPWQTQIGQNPPVFCLCPFIPTVMWHSLPNPNGFSLSLYSHRTKLLGAMVFLVLNHNRSIDEDWILSVSCRSNQAESGPFYFSIG